MKANSNQKGGSVIAAAGRAEARRRRIESAAEIAEAMKAIETDVEKNHGVYPLNRGKITVQEVLRRAGKNSAYLEKKTDRMIALKAEVTAWVAKVNGKILRGAKTIRRAVTDRVVEADDRVKAIMQAWTEAELEYAEAQTTIKDLQEQNASLQKQVSRGKVVPLDRGRQK